MAKIHFMGIGGSGISGVAKLAENMGFIVSGCDLEDSTAYGKDFYKGHDPKHLEGVDLLVVSPAVTIQNPDNPELIEGQKRNTVMTWQEFLGKYLAHNKKVICIAGTHGKSTTTAMVGKLLIDAGFDPSVVLGAVVPEWEGTARFGKGKYLVIEADEFNNNFLNYHPNIIILNNIEFDHPDFFKNEDEVKKSFDKFIENLQGEKILITQKDSLKKKFNLKVLGEHNQKNANMVYVLGMKLGITEETIIKSLESFTGISRRMELIGEKNGITVYDDYAHHPTAIKTTIEGVRGRYPDARIWVVDEPHGYARTSALLSNYKGVFDAADRIMIGPIFKARETDALGMSPGVVAEASGNNNVIGVPTFEEIKTILSEEMKSGDVIVVMGAGKSYLWAREILDLIK